MRILTTIDPVPRPIGVLSATRRRALNRPRTGAETRKLAHELNQESQQRRAAKAAADKQRDADLRQMAEAARRPEPRASRRIQVGRLAPRRRPTAEADGLIAAWAKAARPKPAGKREPTIDAAEVYRQRNRPPGADATKPAPSTPTTPPSFAEMAAAAYGPQPASSSDVIPTSPRGGGR